MKLTEVLKNTRKEKYAVGSFSPRYLRSIEPVLRAAQKAKSPLIVQISQGELERFFATPKEFYDRFSRVKSELGITVPVTLHLDHTKDLAIISAAVDAGFESVMIDASQYPLEENIAITKKAIAIAHPRGVQVEGELGKITSMDKIETDSDSELYTDPEEVRIFVRETGVDVLAISVGTVHGAYLTIKPYIDVKRIGEIRQVTDLPLVLHGASGVPAEMVKSAYQMDCGGVSKINIATDLEAAFLKAIGEPTSLTNISVENVSAELLKKGAEAVEATVTDKIYNFLQSDGKAW
jgi:ketose-bisphosphate aldolase